MFSTTMIGLLGMGLLASPVAGQNQRTTTQSIWLSHLSPLLEYSPIAPTNDAEQGWDVSLARHSSNYSDASVKWFGYTRSFQLGGNSSMIDVAFEGAGDDVPDNTDVYTGGSIDTVLVRRNSFLDSGSNVYNISVSTNSSDGSYLAIDRASIYAEVPADQAAFEDRLPVATHQSATETGFFQDPDGAWEVMQPPSDQSVGIQWQFAGGGGTPSTRGFDFPWNSTVLSTSQVGSPLRFTVPPYTSYLQWDGTVGPDQGKYEFRLIPTGDKEPQFRPMPNNQTYNGQRSVDAIHEVKFVAWLDPRSTYDAEIVLLEDGKRTDLHGISFWRYTEVGSDIQDWWSLPKDDSLSGGQIAGIVVGSVAGAALIGGLIWFLVRRRKRSTRNTRLGSKNSNDA